MRKICSEGKHLFGADCAKNLVPAVDTVFAYFCLPADEAFDTGGNLVFPVDVLILVECFNSEIV